PVMIPMIDIHTIGAGGGSIASMDEGGAFKVGPRSAGSRPGPACYGHGGKKPTVTDAHAVLGRLDEEHFLGGSMRINKQAGRDVIRELADQLGFCIEETAEGILTIVNNNMANAIREKTIQKGYDPREFSLVAFGGAGPLHAVEVAKILNIPEVIIPPHPGITSATGLLTTDLKYDLIKTEFMVSTGLDYQQLNQDFQKLTDQITNQLLEDGILPEQMEMERAADCRYVGQGYELRVPLFSSDLTEESIQKVWDRFHLQHAKEYGHSFQNSPIEIVNIRISGKGFMPKINNPVVEITGRVEDALVKEGKTFFSHDGLLKEWDTNYYQRELLPVGAEITGPAVIFQKDTTTVMPPNCKAKVENNGNIT
ncbi:MAG: hydantoinase/oxoprolinase family protein, partial [Bacillus sp. (in: firmicutes)]